MAVAQRMASLNRKEMMNRIIRHIGLDYIECIESVHNFIGDDMIIRKGATSANIGEKVIIPFNMRDGIAIGVGKGNSQYNYSAPHGAGRIMGRMEAKRSLDLDTFTKQMSDANIYTTTANIDTLDEAPDAYKSMQVILDNIKETVDIVDMIKPIYNFKAGGE
jgi:RNA-splicing ligase RtcB